MEKLWYAVMRDEVDSDWGSGSNDYDEAVEMVQPYLGEGGYIAVIEEGHDPICIREIHFEGNCDER